MPFNRPDGLGVVGPGARGQGRLRAGLDAGGRGAAGRPVGAADDDFDLEIEDREGCPRYIAQVVEGVRIAPSPAWLQRRLEAMGQRPISNVVDVTNLVLFELGQPLHAFDLDRLAGPAIRVRRARAGRAPHDPRRPGARARSRGAADLRPRPAGGDRRRDGRRRDRGDRGHDAAAARVRVVPAAPHPPRRARARPLDRGLEALRARRGPARRRRRDRALPGAARRGLARDAARRGPRSASTALRPRRAARAARLALRARHRHRAPARRRHAPPRGARLRRGGPSGVAGAVPGHVGARGPHPELAPRRHARGRPGRGGGALARLRPASPTRRSRPTASTPHARRASAASSARGAPCWPAASPRRGRARSSPSARRSRPRRCWATRPGRSCAWRIR